MDDGKESSVTAATQFQDGGTTLLALTPVIALVLGLVAFALVSLVRAPAVRYLPKPVWAIVVLLMIPLGAIGYLVFGPDRHSHPEPASGNRGSGPPRRDPTADPTPATAVPPIAGRAAPTAVETVGLRRDYGGAGLFDVDLSVPRGCVYGLVGPNGAGKTTLLSILAGTRRADRGELRVAVPRRLIAVCPDVPEFDPWLTAREVVGLAATLIGAQRNGDSVGAALHVAGLADDADRAVGGFSRGMTQRLGIACALVGEPELLILDEPMSALDPAGRAEILDLVASMRGHRTVIFSSHILADVQRVADRVGVLRQGRLLYQGPTGVLIDDHLQPRWLVRVADDATVLAADLRPRPWVTRIDRVGPDALRVEAATIEDGERGIPVALAACGQRLVSCEPVAADLEAAFLALTGRTDER